MPQRLIFRKNEAVYKKMREGNYLYATSFEKIDKHFLDQLLI